MRSQRLKYMLLWLACLSYAAQAAIGAGKVLCVAAPADAIVEAHADHEGCAHAELDGVVPVAPPHDDDDHCPCVDVALRSDPGRTDDARVELPPVEEVDLGVMNPAFADRANDWRVAARCKHLLQEPANVGIPPDAPRLRCVVLLI